MYKAVVLVLALGCAVALYLILAGRQLLATGQTGQSLEYPGLFGEDRGVEPYTYGKLPPAATGQADSNPDTTQGLMPGFPEVERDPLAMPEPGQCQAYC